MTDEERGAGLIRFKDWAPTQFDACGLGSDGREDWRVVPVIRTPLDFCLLEESNFETAERILDDAGVEYDIDRHGHWAVGHLEILIVAPTSEGLAAAGRIARRLAEYPILDEMDLECREVESAGEAWDHYGHREAVSLLVHRHDLSEASEDLLEDSGEVMWQWHTAGSPEPWALEPSGDLALRLDLWAEMDRDAVAQLLRECRRKA